MAPPLASHHTRILENVSHSFPITFLAHMYHCSTNLWHWIFNSGGSSRTKLRLPVGDRSSHTTAQDHVTLQAPTPSTSPNQSNKERYQPLIKWRITKRIRPSKSRSGISRGGSSSSRFQKQAGEPSSACRLLSGYILKNRGDRISHRVQVKNSELYHKAARRRNFLLQNELRR